jgi:ABC-2 type transport system permease protein
MTRLMLVRKTLRDVRGATTAIGGVIFLMALFDVLIYPEYSKSFQDMEIPEFLKGFLGESGTLATPEGFFSAEFFSWIPLLLITLAIIGGTGTLAGEEAAGTLDLLLAQPVSRTRLIVEKGAGLAVAVILAALASVPGFLLGTMFVDADIGLDRLALASMNMIPISLLFLALSMWGSVVLPNRGAAVTLTVGVVVVSYFIYTLGASVDLLDTPRRLTPFYWADGSRVLEDTLDWPRVLGLLLIAGVFFAHALWQFQRRDIGTTAREWRVRSWFPSGRHRPSPSRGASASRPLPTNRT